jgi:hypothetical protein
MCRLVDESVLLRDEGDPMIRTLLALVAATIAAALLAAAAHATESPIGRDLPPPPGSADLVVSSNNAESFTVTNLPCSGLQICVGTPAGATATNFRVTVTNGYFTFQGLQPYPHWVSSTTSYTVASLAPGATVPFPYSLYGLCGYVFVRVDADGTVAERNEANNTWGISLPPAWICR